MPDEVVGITYNRKLAFQTKNKDYAADNVVLATGSSRSAPKIKGLNEFEEHGVSYCALCDAFFYKEKDIAVLGNGDR